VAVVKARTLVDRGQYGLCTILQPVWICARLRVMNIDDFALKLQKMREQTFNRAVRGTLNDIAFLAMGTAKRTIRKEFINRNKWTQNSLRVKKASLGDLQSEMGSIQPYMKTQEFGGYKFKKPKSQGVVLPTRAASGEGEGAGIRKKLPVGLNKLQRMRVERGAKKRRGKFRSERQANAVEIRNAVQNKASHVYLEKNGKKGLFRLSGRKRMNKERKFPGLKLTLTQDLTRKVVKIPKKPWLAPSLKPLHRRRSAIFNINLKREFQKDVFFK